jgi:hypothetical protein
LKKLLLFINIAILTLLVFVALVVFSDLFNKDTSVSKTVEDEFVYSSIRYSQTHDSPIVYEFECDNYRCFPIREIDGFDRDDFQVIKTKDMSGYEWVFFSDICDFTEFDRDLNANSYTFEQDIDENIINLCKVKTIGD